MSFNDTSAQHGGESIGSPAFSGVRRAGVADAAELHRVAAATFALACPPGTAQSGIDEFVRTTLSEERFRQYLEDSARDILLAEVDGEAVGYVMLVDGPTDPDILGFLRAKRTIELSKCYVLASRHGTGAGVQLIEASLAAAAGRGAAGLWLGVNKQNERANRFYEKCGFAIVGNKTFPLGDELHDDWVRERVL